MKDVLRNVLVLVMVAVLSPLVAFLFGKLYYFVFVMPEALGLSSFVASPGIEIFVAGVVPAYVFLLALIFTAWGAKHKYWWLGVLLLPALAFVLSFDLARIWFYLIVGIVGWGIGYGILMLRASADRTVNET